MIDLKFSKPYDWNGDRCIKVNGKVFFINDDGTIEFAESNQPGDFDESLKNLPLDHFHQQVNVKYKAISKLRVVKKTERAVSISPTHWYRTLPVDVKVELIQRVADGIEELLASQLLGNPTNMLNNYYMSLQDRVRYTKMMLPELMPKDLAKLPEYDPSCNKLYGSPIQFFKLIAACYPAGRRKSKYKQYM